jgi:integrase/recombinase XerD
MAKKKAAILDEKSFLRLVGKVLKGSLQPEVDAVAFLLSYKAGLRVQEIAGLEWDRHILDAQGEIRLKQFYVGQSPQNRKIKLFPVLWISADIGKYGSERTLRIHPLLEKSLNTLLEQRDGEKFVVPSRVKHASQELHARSHALKIRMNRIYKQHGLDACTSHSGRRTFITDAAQQAAFSGCSIADVRDMAGHRSIRTTEAYIETSPQQADLIGRL